MLGELVRKEMQERLLNPAYVITLGFCSILILLSFYTGLRNYTEHLNENNAIQKYHQRILSLQKSYYDVGMLGVQVSQPANPLSTVASGVSNSLGRHATIKMNEPPTITGSKPESNPVFAIFETFDLLFVVKNVLSLVAILFTYNAICGEKENGTLRLMLSFAVPKDQLILSKMVGGFLCLVVPLGVPVLLGVGLMTVFPSVHLSGEDWLRLVCLLGVLGLYVSVFFALGLCVSSCVTRSSASLLVLLSVWVVCVLVIPQGSAILAGQFVNITSKQENRINLEDARMTWLKDNEMKNNAFIERHYGLPDYESLYTKWYPSFLAGANREWAQRQREIELPYWNARHRLLSLAMWLSRISPAAGVTYSVTNLARTGTADHRLFTDAVMRYQRNTALYLQQKRHRENESLHTGIDVVDGSMRTQGSIEEGGKFDISDMPVFDYRSLSFGIAILLIMVDIVLLAVLVLGLFVAAYVFFIKYDAR